METGALGVDQLAHAMALQAASGAPVEDVALAEGMISATAHAEARARHHAALHVSRDATPPDPELRHLVDVETCLAHAIVPWTRIGDAILVATSRPDTFDAAREALPNDIGPVIMGLTSDHDLHDTIAEWYREDLRAAAETRVPDDLSCRSLGRTNGLRAVPLVLGLAMLVFLVLAPQVFFAALAGWAALSLLAALALKLAAFAAHFRAPRDAPLPMFHHRPRVSVLVPLFHETDIAQDLIARLRAITYPKALLDVVLVLEEDDSQTRDLIAGTDLPPWMRTIVVPDGAIRTKPRAMNYALGFVSSEIVGIYDAEDAPDPDQIDLVAARFAERPREVACLQGILDFYNPRANWLSRCFAIEYATWFRVILPGLARLGFAIPLGGTTVFFRRDVLEEVHGWDAHNVTEDADLGIRLARFGYRTELIATVTREEACNHAWPWVRQRSRWLKGYMVTYLAHMRHPLRLWRDLRPWKFLGFQVFFLSSLSQFLLAPVLWSFWVVLIGLAHPLDAWIGGSAVWHLGLAFLFSEVTALVIGAVAVSRTDHRGLTPWIPTLVFYFPLGCAAAYKGLIEVLARPFFWDKTTHGKG
ncbi:glycosyl transferase [Pseudaestuariivita atlantica]|uniref:Glycosyl transferase n=1 Tax=Pseudaestuariivita atlantica TaxID=1317121 RepID=A0A0L1JP24_9RHOB|nr:glycosyl transferase [Pseudaestuariivita atlantica]